MKMVKRLLLLPVMYLLNGNAADAQTKTAELHVNSKQDLEASRVKIDSLDKQLIKIIGERERIAKAIGVYKAKNNIPPLQEARFKQVVANSVAAGALEGLSAEFVTELMNAIHKESLRIENDTAILKH